MVDEVHGFKYFDERDLLGFVDGTENPVAAAAAAVVIGAEDPASPAAATSSCRSTCTTCGWNALSVEEQERAIGRTKLSNIELADDVKPPNSHVALNMIMDPDGTERQILRDNMAFGSVGTGRVRHLLHRLLAHPERDRADAARTCSSATRPAPPTAILEFSTAVTGCLFFVPPADLLEDPPAAADAPR